MANATYEPATLASKDFAKEFSTLFDKYIALRVDGTPADLAVIEAFELIPNGISLDNAHLLGMACDVNPYVKDGLQKALAAADIKRDLWPQRKAVHRLLSIVEDPRERASNRITAINSLNVMCGYIVLDDALTSRVDKTISDFKRQHAAWMEAGSPTAQPTPPPASGGAVH